MPRNYRIYSLVFLLSTQSWAGTLDDLEDDATKPVKRSSSSQSSSGYSNDDNNDSSLDSFFAELLFKLTAKTLEVTATTLIAGGINSQTRYEENNEHSGRSLFRTKGDPILPTIGYTAHWLSANDDINAQLNRIELGYGLIGISYSENTLDENGRNIAHYSVIMTSNNDQLKIINMFHELILWNHFEY